MCNRDAMPIGFVGVGDTTGDVIHIGGDGFVY